MDFLTIYQHLHNPDLVGTFLSKITSPKISYEYTPTIGSVTFNYSKLSKPVIFDNFDNYPCTCAGSRFKDDFHDHIVTANLEVFDNEQIRSVFQFGANYRVVPYLNINKINNYISIIFNRLRANSGFFSDWKGLFMHTVYNK